MNETGDDNTVPDAFLAGEEVLLRAERDGGSNGRVYQVSFTAADGPDGVCTGTVTVGVPKSRRQTPVDDGQAYDSAGEQ